MFGKKKMTKDEQVQRDKRELQIAEAKIARDAEAIYGQSRQVHWLEELLNGD